MQEYEKIDITPPNEINRVFDYSGVSKQLNLVLKHLEIFIDQETVYQKRGDVSKKRSKSSVNLLRNLLSN